MVESFINSLKILFKKNISFEEASIFQQSPYNYEFRQKELQKNIPRLSAILILIYPKNDELYSVLMLRNTYNGEHSGQISFPGGKKESNENLEETAIREFEEEVGVIIKKNQLLKKMTDVYIPPSNFLVTPYLGFSEKTPTFSPNKREVAKLIEFPIRMLLDKDIIETTNNTPYFNIQNQFVWGATALILSELQFFLLKMNDKST